MYELEAFQKKVAETKKLIRHLRTHQYIMLYEEHQIIMESKLLQQGRKNRKKSD